MIFLIAERLRDSVVFVGEGMACLQSFKTSAIVAFGRHWPTLYRAIMVHRDKQAHVEAERGRPARAINGKALP